MIIFRPRHQFDPPPPLPSIIRVKTLKILGVILQVNLKLTAQIGHLTATCSSSFYAIRKLKTHGLSSSSSHNVTKATTVAKLLYDSPSWWGLTLAPDKERLEKLIKRAKRLGYLEQSFPTVSELANKADAKLLFSILHNPKHVLHLLLPPSRPISSHQLTH